MLLCRYVRTICRAALNYLDRDGCRYHLLWSKKKL